MPANASIPPLLLSEREAAKLMAVSVRTLFSWREHEGLPHVKIGARVLYRPADLERWIGEHVTRRSWRGRASVPEGGNVALPTVTPHQ